MPKICAAVLVVVVLALAPGVTHGQVVAGTTFWFDHAPEDAADTERYELCVDTVTNATCAAIGVVRVGTTHTYRFTLPASVARGTRALSVRAVGVLDTGTSGPSNVVTVRVIGKPGSPMLLRLTEVTP